VTNEGTQVSRTSTSNGEGQYTVPFLQPGTYRAEVTADGFQALVREGLKLEVGQSKTVEFELNVGQPSQTVTVSGDTGLINMSDGSVSTVIGRQLVANLPLNGRGFNTLMELTPGVSLTKPTYANEGQFSVNGQRGSSNYFTVDGVSANTGVPIGAGL